MANGNQSRIERINRTEARYLANYPKAGGVAKATNLLDNEERQRISSIARTASKGNSGG